MYALVFVGLFLVLMIVPFGVVPLVSLFTRPPEAERLEQAFSGIGNP